MQPDFWHTRWREGKIGFHRTSVHEQLQRFAERLAALRTPPRVLVPLCGKSRDMVYLAERGDEVVGVELSEIASHAFFAEQGCTPDIDSSGAFLRFSADRVTMLCGDFFELTPAVLGLVHAAYDRAALVALPPALRKRYAAHLATLLPIGAPMLLITFDYLQEGMPGPPFAVLQSEVQELFGAHFEITLLDDRDVLDENERFKENLSRLCEQTYLLVRTGS